MRGEQGGNTFQGMLASSSTACRLDGSIWRMVTSQRGELCHKVIGLQVGHGDGPLLRPTEELPSGTDEDGGQVVPLPPRPSLSREPGACSSRLATAS